MWAIYVSSPAFDFWHQLEGGVHAWKCLIREMIGWKQSFERWKRQRCTEVKVKVKFHLWPLLELQPGIYNCLFNYQQTSHINMSESQRTSAKPSPSQVSEWQLHTFNNSGQQSGNCAWILLQSVSHFSSLFPNISRNTHLYHLYHFHFGPMHYLLPGLSSAHFQPWPQ